MDGRQILDVALTLGEPSLPRSLSRALRLRTLGPVLALFALFFTLAWITNSITVVNDIICKLSPHLFYNTFLTPSLGGAFDCAQHLTQQLSYSRFNAILF